MYICHDKHKSLLTAFFNMLEKTTVKNTIFSKLTFLEFEIYLITHLYV